MKFPRIITMTVLALLAFVLSIAIARSVELRPKLPNSADSDPPALFTPIQSTGRGSLSTTDRTVIRQRAVTANTSLLTRTRGGIVNLNLFEDVTYAVVIERVEEQPATPNLNPPSQSRGSSAIKLSGATEPIVVQFGRVQNSPKSEVYLVSSGDRLSASVRLPDGKLYDVVPTGTKAHVIREINPASFPPDETPGVWERMQRSPGRGIQSRPAQTTYEVLPKDSPLNVLVLYTPKLRKVVGDEKAMALLIAKVQAQTNQGYEQSGIKLRVKIAKWGEVDYPESANSEKDLEVLNQAAIANKLRQQYQVDAVSLWVSTLKDSCGIGTFNQTSAEFHRHALNVVSVDCAVNNFSFAHELGHNLGSCHDRESSKTCVGSFPYSFGYQDPDGDFRTIMSYPCKANKECPRLNYWSSPNLVVNQKKPMGVEEEVDNVRSLNHVT